MAYRDDVNALGPSSYYLFDGNANDYYANENLTGSGVTFTRSALCADATNCVTVDAFTDRIPISNPILATTRKAVAGWFLITEYSAHPVRIYGEGTPSLTFQIVLGYGNQTLFEVRKVHSTQGIANQVFGIPLVPNRAYHLTAIFLDNANGNRVKFYVDGVEQTDGLPTSLQPDQATLTARNAGTGFFADPSSTVGLGNSVVLLQSATNGDYSHWAFWNDTADADLTATEVRQTLFERGALATHTIASGTESTMQTAVDSLPASIGNVPCAVEIEAVSGGGDFTLTSDTVFDPLGSIDVRYNGTAGTLSFINTGSGNAATGSAPFGGAIKVKTRQTLTFTVKDAVTGAAIQGARVYVETDTGGPATAGTLVVNDLTDASGQVTATYDFESDQPITGYVRKGSASVFYKQNSIGGSLTETPLNTTILLVKDE